MSNRIPFPRSGALHRFDGDTLTRDAQPLGKARTAPAAEGSAEPAKPARQERQARAARRGGGKRSR